MPTPDSITPVLRPSEITQLRQVGQNLASSGALRGPNAALGAAKVIGSSATTTATMKASFSGRVLRGAKFRGFGRAALLYATVKAVAMAGGEVYDALTSPDNKVRDELISNVKAGARSFGASLERAVKFISSSDKEDVVAVALSQFTAEDLNAIHKEYWRFQLEQGSLRSVKYHLANELDIDADAEAEWLNVLVISMALRSPQEEA